MKRFIATLIPFVVLLVACQGPETQILKRYFSAVQFHDNTTMAAMAVEPSAPNVVKWEMVSVGEETAGTAQLRALVQAEEQLKLKMEEAKTKAREAKEAKDSAEDALKAAKKKDKGSAQSAVETKKSEWDLLVENVKAATKEYNDAKNATALERKTIALSVGELADLETMDGEFRAKDCVVKLTIKQEDNTEAVKDYVVALRQYKMRNPTTGRQIRGKWIILTMKPQA
ncbi:MAG: hypothetical protein AB1714_25275 [Acidobacteriota bacterium]